MSASEDEPVTFPGLQALETDDAWSEVQVIIDDLVEQYPDQELDQVYDFRNATEFLNYVEEELVPDESDMGMALEEVQRLWDYFQDVQEHSAEYEEEAQFRRDADRKRSTVITQFDDEEDDAWIRYQEEEYIEE